MKGGSVIGETNKFAVIVISGEGSATVSVNASVFYHHLFAFFGVIIGGKFSDKLALKRKQVRMEVEFWGLLLGAPFIYMMAVGETKLICYTGMALFGLFRGIYDSNLFAALFDVIEPKYRASSIGIMLAFAFLIGALAPVILGWVKTVAGLEIGFASLSLFYLTGSILIFIAMKLFFKQNYYEETSF